MGARAASGGGQARGGVRRPDTDDATDDAAIVPAWTASATVSRPADSDDRADCGCVHTEPASADRDPGASSDRHPGDRDHIPSATADRADRDPAPTGSALAAADFAASGDHAPIDPAPTDPDPARSGPLPLANRAAGRAPPQSVAPNPAASAFAALPLPAIIFDAAGNWAGLNEAAELWLNLSARSVAGLRADDPALAARLRVSPELGALLDPAAAAEEPTLHPRVTFEISDRAGGWMPRRAALRLAALPGGGVVALIHPDQADADAGRRAARAAIGMADMLAHEIKNPVAGIRGAAQLLAEGLGPADRELTDLIVAESRRIVALLDQVERFGDTTAPQRRAVNLHDILDRARRSVDLGGARARMVADYDPSLPLALIDPDRMMQVMLNLIRNAAEALARDGRSDTDPRGPGLIRIRSSYDGGVRAPDGSPLPLQVDIEDDGPGIPDAIADQIFEPFVSGRENGTGLGLALAGKIVAEHGGRIRVDSRPGRTNFRVSLPRDRAGTDREGDR